MEKLTIFIFVFLLLKGAWSDDLHFIQESKTTLEQRTDGFTAGSNSNFHSGFTETDSLDETFIITWTERPVQFQLFARESNDSGDIIIQGTITNNEAYYDTCLTKLYRNNLLIRTTYQTLSYIGSNAYFNFTDKIKSEKAEYKLAFSLRKPFGLGDSLLYEADSLVAGDVYVINGQSNVFFAPTDGGLLNFTNQYIRTFGIQTTGLNSTAYNIADTTWGKSQSFFTGSPSPRNVGGLGQFLQRYILDTFNIPTCIINGSLNNSSIKAHTRNNEDPDDLTTQYGKLLYRVTKAKVQNKIKAIIWFQGESDVAYSVESPQYLNPRGYTDPYLYPVYFDSLYSSWVTDFDFGKIFVYQIRQIACNYMLRQSVFREKQRQFQTIYHDTVQVLPTVGIGGRNGDNCHYLSSGYDQLAHNLFRRLRQLYYTATDTVGMRAPTITKAFYTSSDKNKIGMLFDGSNPASIPADTLGKDIEKYFYLDDVRTTTATSLTLLNDTLYLNLPSSSSATYINYLPPQDSVDLYNGPFIRNSRGIAMLTFDSVKIEPADPVLKDISVTELITPVNGSVIPFGSILTPQASFKNNGLDLQSNVQVHYKIIDSLNNEIYNQTALIDTIASGASKIITFPVSSSLNVPGTYIVRAYSELSEDQITSNDTLSGSMSVPLLLNDISAAELITPVNGSVIPFGSILTPRVAFTNNGISLQSNVQVHYKIIDSLNTEIYNQTASIDTIASGVSKVITFPASSSLNVSGTYIIKTYSQLSGDQITSNDTLGGSMSIPLLLNDISAAELISPLQGSIIPFGSSLTPQVSFRNNGLSLQNNVQVHYKIFDSLNAEIYNQTALIEMIEAGETNIVTFPISNSFTTSGAYAIKVYSELSGDQITSNDTLGGSMSIPLLLNDISATELISPLQGSIIPFGSTLTPQVSFRNNGLSLQNNVQVHYKIFDSLNTEIYSQTALIEMIAAGETNIVTFPISNSFTASGAYVIKAYSELLDDQITANDTVSGNVIIPPAMEVVIIVLPEGKYSISQNLLMKRDTITAYLRKTFSPFEIIDSARGIADSITFSNTFSFINSPADVYYIEIRHYQCIETWSKAGGEYLTIGTTVNNYDFTIDQDQAYGSNLKLIGDKYCLLSGDVNQDGMIDLNDLNNIYNASINFSTGYLNTDLTGDGNVDLSDITIVYNNNVNFASVERP